MANVGVTFDFAAESAKLRSEIDKVRKEVSGLNATAKSIGDAFGTMGKAIVGAFSVGAIVSNLESAAKAAIEFGDSMQKAAARTGIGAGQFALLADVAKMSDIGVESLSKSLGKMQVAISEAASGSDAQLRAFQALGIQFEALRQAAPEDQFLRIADQISKLQDPADRTRAAVELFGKSGAELLPLFEQGAAGIRTATDEIIRLGGAMSDEQIAKLSAADDAVKRLSQSWQIFARALTAEVAPALTAVLDHLSNADTSKADASRASQIRALLESRGPMVDFYTDTKALQVELAALEERLAGVARQRQLLAVSRGGGSGVLSDLPPGFAPLTPKTTDAKDKKQTLPFGEMTPSVFASADTLGIGTLDPTVDPEYVRQQELQLAKIDLLAGYHDTALGMVTEFESTKLGMLLTNNDLAIAAEQAKNATLGTTMSTLVGLAIQQGGALGKAGKALAIAQTIWNTASAVIKSYNNAGGYPWGIAPAAAMAAAGAAQLAKITSTNIGSGGGGSVASASGGAVSGTSPALSDTSIPANRDQKLTQQSAVQIIFNGPVAGGPESVRWITEAIGDLINNRDLVFINGTSRQAAELRA